MFHRQVTPAQFEMDAIMDPQLRDQLNKVKVVADPEIEAVFPELQRVIVKITTTDGKEFSAQLDYPKGDPRNPLTDREVEEKFDALASPVLTDQARGRVKEAVWNLDKLDSVTELMELCRADR
jgi:2-methylcitrate dehydratase